MHNKVIRYAKLFKTDVFRRTHHFFDGVFAVKAFCVGMKRKILGVQAFCPFKRAKAFS